MTGAEQRARAGRRLRRPGQRPRHPRARLLRFAATEARVGGRGDQDRADALVTGTSVVLVEGQDHVTAVARDAVNGRVRWRDSLSGPSEGYLPVLAAGPLAILQGEPGVPGAVAPLRAYQTASGRLAWQAGMPAFVQSPPVLVPGGILVQPADPMYACAAG